MTDATLLGEVRDVQGPSVNVRLDSRTVSGLSFVDGVAYRIGQVGSFVRIPLGYVDLFGIVTQVGAGAVPPALRETLPNGERWIAVQLVGEGDRKSPFQRGVSQYPTIGDQAHLVTDQDLARIYGHPDSPNFVRVGVLASAESIPAFVDVNRLLTRHSAVVGATGTGKSTTVAGLLCALSDGTRFPSARVIVLDMHGEYARALNDRARVFRVGADASRGEVPLQVPYWAMTFDELVPLTFKALDDKSRGAVVDRIVALKTDALCARVFPGVSPDTLTVDSPVPFCIHRLWFDLYCEVFATHVEKKGVPQSPATWALLLGPDGKALDAGDVMSARPPRFRPPKDVAGDDEKIRLSRSQLNVGSAVEVLGSRLRDPRFNFLFRPGDWMPGLDNLSVRDLDDVLLAWVGGDRPITILDLSGIPSSVVIDLVGALVRIIYDALFWARNLPEGGRERPLLFVLEEAHSYLGQRDASPAALAVRKIVKEGRKYGIGAMIVSQRPSEIDATILSQCGTLFALRLPNATDRGHVTSTASDYLEGLFAMLPALRTGEAIIVGEAVSLPMRTLIDAPAANRRPDSSDPQVVVRELAGDGFEGPGGWNQPRELPSYADVVELWRRQDPRARRLHVAEVPAPAAEEKKEAP